MIRLQQYLKEGQTACKSLWSIHPEPAGRQDPDASLELRNLK